MNLDLTKRKINILEDENNPIKNDESKKIKNDRTIKENENYTEFYLPDYSQLPQEILILIFKYLNIRERCQMARVCKRWRNVCYDEMLWYHIDLNDSCLDLKKLWNLFRHRCFKNAQSIRICGNLKNPHSKKSQQQSISKALMEKLRLTCLNLKIIEIGYCDLNSIDVNDLPNDLEQIKLIRCEIPLKWFQNNKFKKLELIDLSESSRICCTHLKDLFSNKLIKYSLKSLILRKCYRVDDKSIEALCQLIDICSSNVIDLNLIETSITPVSLQILAKYLSNNIRLLNVKNCKYLENLDINSIRSLFSGNEFFELIT